MIEADSKERGEYLFRLAALFAALVLISLCVGSNRGAPPAKDLDMVSTPDQQLRAAAFREATKAATTSFRPSLEMKENVDFLLAPALLVQEALSQDMIITYPSE